MEEPGLSTREALHKLVLEIEQVLHQFKSSQKSRKGKSWVKDTLHHSSQHTTRNWISASFLLWSSISLMLYYTIEDKDDTSPVLVLESIVILLLLVVNLSIELYDNKLRHEEISNRVRAVVDRIRQATDKIDWKSDNYPDLCSPVSPCITLQWTYRDGKLVNLPWALLVKDDVIVIRPGQPSPGYCESLDKSSEYPLLHSREIYAPSLQSANEIFSAPKCRRSQENRPYRLLETPYLNNLRVYLEQSLDRPVTQLNQQRHMIMIRIVERFVLPTIFLTVVVVNLFRYFISGTDSSGGSMFLLVPTATVLPLLMLIFPIAWNCLNYLGMARFHTIYTTSCQIENFKRSLQLEEEGTMGDQMEIRCDHRNVIRNFVAIVRGDPAIMTHSANILHVLGAVTALGCVDKKGILSWPNPTAEKVFFLHNNGEADASQSSSLSNVGDLDGDGDSLGGGNSHFRPHDSPCSATAEVLDLTHNTSDTFKLHFDDQDWRRYLASLKPLGLAILLNTCNMQTQEHYTSFCSHIACEAIYNENLVPVTNRRCLCELAKEIGFVDQAQKIFALEQQLCTYRHLQPEMVRRDNKYARSLQLSTKLKFPFPHTFAVIVKELSSGSIQLLSEGTADLILDSCVDYWDGHDLCPLSHSDRKKIQDFYQRSSLTAYCTAFAYRPLHLGVENSKLSDIYLELPSDSRHLYLNHHRSPTPVHWDCKSVLEPRIRTQLGQFYSTDSLLYNECPSVDISDADSCFQVQCNQIFIGMVTMQYQALTDMVQLIEQLERACIRFVHFSKENELRSRVFSEKMGLESGWNCHISLLSERNRRDDNLGSTAVNIGNHVSATAPVTASSNLGFSTRGGAGRRLSQSARKLDLFSDADRCGGDVSRRHDDDDDQQRRRLGLLFDSNLESSRTMSFSAPSAINMEHSVVKFDTNTETVTTVAATDCHSSDQSAVNGAAKANDNNDNGCGNYNNEINTSHDWQSLSCLTDSTEQSAPIHFDMSNRAKLPRGIDKIRPHIELIDNVPLLVSLFTDCTPNAIKEMLNIMQDYGEIVCIMGSSASYENAPIFMQADASIAVDPLFPQVCQKTRCFAKPDGCPSPLDVSRDLNTVACSMCLKREDPVSFHHLVMEARHFVTSLWNSLQFWLCCCTLLSLAQLASVLAMAPVLFDTGAILYLSCAAVPLLSVSLMGARVDPEVMKRPVKNQIDVNWDVSFFICWCYGLKFLPTLVVCLVTFLGILAEHCWQMCEPGGCTCRLFYLPSSEGGWGERSWSVSVARLVVFFVVLLHFAVISIGFVYRDYLIYRRPPLRNFAWLVTVIVLVILQCLYFGLNYFSMRNSFAPEARYEVPLWIVIFTSLSPLAVLAINEIVKKQEITVNKRFRKRARLDFGTKLGMNSPF